MGFISKLIPSVIIGGIGFWILTMVFESLYLQTLGSLVIAIVFYCILSMIDRKKKKQLVKKDEEQKQTQ